jgi:hypothetical protein
MGRRTNSLVSFAAVFNLLGQALEHQNIGLVGGPPAEYVEIPDEQAGSRAWLSVAPVCLARVSLSMFSKELFSIAGIQEGGRAPVLPALLLAGPVGNAKSGHRGAQLALQRQVVESRRKIAEMHLHDDKRAC